MTNQEAKSQMVLYRAKLLDSVSDLDKDIEEKLCSIFAECGIAFGVVNGYEEVPVLGLIKRRSDENLVVCVTKKSGYDYSFWFALFHEIAHVIMAMLFNVKMNFQEV